MTNQNQLSNDELAELDQFLFQEDEETEMLSLDEAHGFTTAILIGMPSLDEAELLTLIWGEPVFQDASEGERLRGLLLKMRSEIQGNLASSEPFEPLSIEEELDGESFDNLEGWCFGFMLGLSHLEATWRLGDKEEDIVAPIATLAMIYNDEDEELDDDDYEQCLELLPGAVTQLYRLSCNARERH